MKLFLLLSMLAIDVTAKQSATPCTSPEASQFDFWVGDWNLTWTDAKGNVATGHNLIEKILGSCVISESFEDPNSGFVGKSHSVYDLASGKWKQTWVDNSGAYLDFVGAWEDGKMILSRSIKTKDGRDVTQRMVWSSIQASSLDWNWEASTDGGKTWKINWKIHYEKRKKS